MSLSNVSLCSLLPVPPNPLSAATTGRIIAQGGNFKVIYGEAPLAVYGL